MRASTPVLRAAGNDYVVTWGQFDMEAEVTRLHEARNSTQGEVIFRYLGSPQGRRLIARKQISLTSGAPQFVNTLKKIAPSEDINWDKVMEELCYLVLERHREGEPTINLATYQPKPRQWIIEPFLEKSGPTVLFGPGGSGKSFIALAMATGVAAGIDVMGKTIGGPTPVLYLDLEVEIDEHARRFKALRRGLNLSDEGVLVYKRIRSPLHTVVDSLAREVAEGEYGMVVIDSLGKASGGEPESAEVKLRTFMAIDQLRVPCLCVDHLSKDAMRQQDGRLSPYGSIYTENSARLTWSVKAVGGRGNSWGSHSSSIVVLENQKANTGPLARKRGYSLRWNDNGDSPAEVHISETDIADMPQGDDYYAK